MRERLKQLMTSNSTTVSQLAKAVDCSEHAVTYWISGETVPSATDVINICKFFDVTADYFLFGK